METAKIIRPVEYLDDAVLFRQGWERNLDLHYVAVGNRGVVCTSDPCHQRRDEFRCERAIEQVARFDGGGIRSKDTKPRRGNMAVEIRLHHRNGVEIGPHRRYQDVVFANSLSCTTRSIGAQQRLMLCNHFASTVDSGNIDVVEFAGGILAWIAQLDRLADVGDGCDVPSHHGLSASGNLWRTCRLRASRRLTASCRSIGAASDSKAS